VRRPIRIGLLSVAHYHGHFWAEAFRESPLADFVGIWDDDAARGEAAGARHGVRFWADLDQLLEASDAVGITSETVQHASLVEAAARRGRHVLCEKPLAATLADCDHIARVVAETGIVFMQSFPKRFDPASHALRRLVQTGALGRLVLLRVRHGHFYGLDPEFRRGWHVDPARSGGGALLDEGVHAADFLRWLLGEPESVTATVSSAALGLGGEDTAVAVFRFPDGVLGEIATGIVFVAGDNSVELYGTEGTAVLAGVDLASRDLTEGAFLRTYQVGQPRCWTVSPLVPRFKTGGFHQQNPLEFLRALHAGEPPPVTLEDGRRAVEMIQAAYRAAESGRREAVAR
jgi:myo-inositol 2-dehydrogenase/D-chiro-inositol 1-dehydrogenase